MAKSLYICYFGMREPLVQTQVLPYLRELRKDGHEISLLTFEPEMKRRWNNEEIAVERTKLAAEGIDWHCLPYHKKFSAVATAWDIFCGTLKVRRLNRRNKYDILHCRIHVPGLMALLARPFSGHKPKILFDIRGFFPEEFVDAGNWPADGILYRAAKYAERKIMAASSGFVVLTHKAREILFPETGSAENTADAVEKGYADKLGRPVEVIPCCIDQKRFELSTAEAREQIREILSIGERRVLAYVGSFGTWYMLDETVGLMAAGKKRDQDLFLLILTQSPREMVEPLLLERGFNINDIFISRVAAAEVPKYLAAADAAVSFIKPSYSKRSSSPTKNAEYLACGLPIIANRGVGDVDELIEGNKAGVLIDTFNEESYARALEELENMGNISDRCRSVAMEEFDLSAVGGKRYRRLYSRLIGHLPAI